MTHWLRAAAILTLLFALGHSAGGFREWSPMGANPVLSAMRTVHFDTQGVHRSYLEFYLGFGWMISLLEATFALLLWQLAGLARRHAAALRPLVAVLAASQIGAAVVAWRFIFPLPALFSLAIAVLLLVACLRVPREVVAA